MNRILLDNSNAVRRALSAAATAGSRSAPAAATTTPVILNHIGRRWKSVVNQQKQRPNSLSTLSSAQTFNARSSSIDGGFTCRNTTPLPISTHCRSLSTSTAVQLKTSDNMSNKCLQLDNINPNFITMEYAVRGPLVIRAGEIENELKQVSDEIVRQKDLV